MNAIQCFGRCKPELCHFEGFTGHYALLLTGVYFYVDMSR